MKRLISVAKQGPDVVEKEANKWWGGIAHMESKLGYPISELEKLYWLDAEFETEMEEKDLEIYKREEIQIATIVQGRLQPKKISAYKSGKRYFVTKNDYANLTELKEN